jgi:hypothetical protein
MMLEERIQKELDLLRTRYDVAFSEEGRWGRISAYPLPPGWNRSSTDVVFQIPVGYPGTPAYGIYVPVGIAFNGQTPESYQEPAPSQPPFGEQWGIFSWQPDGEWRATADIVSGSNLMNWVIGFAARFREGR